MTRVLEEVVPLHFLRNNWQNNILFRVSMQMKYVMELP